MTTKAFQATEVWSNYLLPKLKPTPNDSPVEFKENGKPVVYKRRWFILAAFCMGYFLWNLHTLRQTPLVAEYADYFNTTNEFAPPELGVDFMLILDGIILVLFYPIGGLLVDTFGLKMMVIGSVGQTIATWWWFLSYDDFGSVLLARALGSVAGLLVATSFLRITTTWFAPSERPLAIGLGVIFSELGAGSALIIGPIFNLQPDDILDLNLKSCKDVFKDTVVEPVNDTCSEDARKAFCCLIPTDIDSLNMTMAIVATVVMVFTLLVTRESPPTPPSRAAVAKKGPGLWQGMKLMFKNRNYTQICLADFIMSGPPQVLFAVLSRVFPESVADYDVIAGAAGLVLALPAAAVFGFILGRNKKYYEMTAGTYAAGFIFWLLATITLAIATPISEIIFLVVAVLALITLILWTLSVYELKAEYVFDKEYNLEGFIVGVDRTLINLSALIFLAAIPPERVDGNLISGPLFTFVAGLGFMFIGTIVVFTVRNKRLYKRQAFEAVSGEEDNEEKVKAAAIEDAGAETGINDVETKDEEGRNITVSF